MLRRAAELVILVLIVGGCGDRQATTGESGLPPAEPDWSECVTKGEFETCTEVCAAQDMQCAANACPAEPMYCKPDDCDMATSLLGLDGICTDPSLGVYVASPCDDPIEFIFTDTARCCCES